MAKVYSYPFICLVCGKTWTDDPTRNLVKCPVAKCKGFGIAKS